MIKLIILLIIMLLLINYQCKKQVTFALNEPFADNPLNVLKRKYNYVGCFKDNKKNIFTRKIRNKLSDEPITIQECEDKVRENRYSVYGIQNFDTTSGKGECYADNNLNRAMYQEVSEAARYGKCYDYETTIDENKVTLKVGDKSSNAVYTSIEPTYEFLGCFKDDPNNRKMEVDKRHIEFRFCEPVAKTDGYKYYAVQDWGKYAFNKGNCFMTNNLDKSIELGYGQCKTVPVKTNYINTGDGTLSERIIGLENSNAIYGRNY